ncbi:lasso peptide biosynthesis B2 protein [Thermoclostridium caenicola]|nr:lasso peptide biosynthesis B2 protein [Thermoclostridium caenicola]
MSKLKRILSTFVRLSLRMKILVIVSFAVLGIMRLLMILLPFRRLTALMGKAHQESPYSLDPASQILAQEVGFAINIVSNHTPWKSECLVKALAAQFILKVLNISSTLYLGVSKDDSNHLTAHAWVRSGNQIITGAFEYEDQFKCVDFFAS